MRVSAAQVCLPEARGQGPRQTGPWRLDVPAWSTKHHSMLAFLGSGKPANQTGLSVHTNPPFPKDLGREVKKKKQVLCVQEVPARGFNELT